MTPRTLSRDSLIESHLPLARALAYRYRNSPEPLEDLVQVASLALVKAADRWDPDRGAAFSSYAVPTILGELRRYFRDSTWDVRPPRALQERSLSLDRARKALLERTGREPTAAQLATHLERPVEEVIAGLRALNCRRLPSLDAPVHVVESEEISVGDTVGGEDPGYCWAEADDAFDRIVARFADNQTRAILRLRFERELVQSEISARIGCSQMQVSRIIKRALERLAGSPQLSAAA